MFNFKSFNNFQFKTVTGFWCTAVFQIYVTLLFYINKTFIGFIYTQDVPSIKYLPHITTVKYGIWCDPSLTMRILFF
jgi:uncharacterized membrane protein YpjA